jgi:hypothetical protein
MAQYRSIVLPSKRALRAYVLATLHRDSAVVWELPDGAHVESRASWDAPPPKAPTPRR